jgi:hypothetical protein
MWGSLAISLLSMSRTQSTRRFISNANAILSEVNEFRKSESETTYELYSDSQFMETDNAMIALFQLAILFTQRSMNDLDTYFGDKTKWKSCLAIVFSLLRSRHVEVGVVALNFFKKIIAYDVSGSVVDLIETMINLMETSDIISEMVGGMMAEIGLRHPQGTLGILVKHLDSKNRELRLNTVLVIKHMIHLDKLQLEKHLTETMKGLHKDLAYKLLSLLYEDDIELRKHVSEIFLIIDPDVIVQELCKRTFDKDPRARSAASASLTHLLKTHSNLRACLLILLEYLGSMGSSSPIPSTPSDIYSSFDERFPATVSRDADLLIIVVCKWCSVASAAQLRLFFSILIQKCIDSPKNLPLIALSSRAGIHLKEKEVVEDIFESIIFHLEHQEV